MKIISWNINGIRSILGQNPSKKYDKITKDNKLFEYILKESPDIICLQETKADMDQINVELRFPPGYEGIYHSCRRKKGYSGVVTFYKKQPISNEVNIGIEKFDEEGRIIASDFGDFILYNVYFPNGTSGQERIDYKLDFYDSLFNHIEKQRELGKKIIVTGDFNTAHNEIDLARPKENVNNSGFLPIEREKLDWIFSKGWTDTFRIFNKDGENYTWWSNRGGARENNVGWRIDYFVATNDLLPKIKDVYHQTDEQGSDHCPIIMIIE